MVLALTPQPPVKQIEAQVLEADVCAGGWGEGVGDNVCVCACVCVCVRAYVCVCVRARARARVCVCVSRAHLLTRIFQTKTYKRMEIMTIKLTLSLGDYKREMAILNTQFSTL